MLTLAPDEVISLHRQRQIFPAWVFDIELSMPGGRAHGGGAFAGIEKAWQ